jgi:hypothetical protein
LQAIEVNRIVSDAFGQCGLRCLNQKRNRYALHQLAQITPKGILDNQNPTGRFLALRKPNELAYDWTDERRLGQHNAVR